MPGIAHGALTGTVIRGDSVGLSLVVTGESPDTVVVRWESIRRLEMSLGFGPRCRHVAGAMLVAGAVGVGLPTLVNLVACGSQPLGCDALPAGMIGVGAAGLAGAYEILLGGRSVDKWTVVPLPAERISLSMLGVPGPGLGVRLSIPLR